METLGLIQTFSAFVSMFKTDEFFFAGGYVLSVTHGTHRIAYSDIDIFFETEHAFNTAYNNCTLRKSYESNHAVTYDYGQTTVQLIKTSFKPINDILEDFDINKSRVAYGKTGTIIHETQKKDFYVDFDNFKSTTFSRVLKYRDIKNFDVNDSILKTIDFMYKNKDILYDSYYNGEPEQATNIQMLSKFLNVVPSNESINMMMYMQGLMKTEEFAEVASRYSNPGKEKYMKRKEYHLSRVIRTKKFASSVTEEMKNEIIREYPEYFI